MKHVLPSAVAAAAVVPAAPAAARDEPHTPKGRLGAKILLDCVTRITYKRRNLPDRAGRLYAGAAWPHAAGFRGHGSRRHGSRHDPGRLPQQPGWKQPAERDTTVFVLLVTGTAGFGAAKNA
jgi:hypothetical protein